MTLQAVVLAAGKGTRLGRPLPKPLTQLADGRSILAQQVDNLRQVLGEQLSITAVVGYKAPLIMEALPTLLFAYNEDYEDTNTSKSLLRALELSADGPVVWLNGDVVFEPALLELLLGPLARGESAVCVNTASVAEEEVKYTVDDDGYVKELSKTVVGGLGEAVGINLVGAADKALLVENLRACGDQDYFERGIELSIAQGMKVLPVDISAHVAVEVDFEEDLARAERLVAEHRQSQDPQHP